MVEQIKADKTQMMMEYLAKYKGNAFYSRINAIACEHSLPVDLRVKAVLQAMAHSKNEDKVV